LAQVRVREELAAPARSAWALLRDFGEMSAWAPQARVLRVAGTGVGALRHVESAIGIFIERCESHDEAGRAFSYSIVESPWPMERYLASVCVVATGPRSCAIEWACEFATASGSTADFAIRLERLYRGFIAALRERLRGAPG
jgi:hypothetical protein